MAVPLLSIYVLYNSIEFKCPDMKHILPTIVWIPNRETIDTQHLAAFALEAGTGLEVGWSYTPTWGLVSTWK